ncbi:hypothetical protein [Kribbella sp. NPDC051770]|uniref:hypothetical protein n=1 Tax=Kribbella sp. NPDC051770 TaxID=3155413 RepID=UPI00342B5123
MRLRRESAQQQLPEIDPCMGDPAARSFCDALSARDWPTARGILERTEHPDDRAFLLDTAGSALGVQNWIGAVDDPLAQLVQGCHAVAWAWQARGGYQAQYTRADQFRLFFERLRIAESCLYDVVARDPDEVAAWAFLVRTARGLQLPLEDGEFRFRQATERQPTHLKAHEEWLQTLCAKWQGNEQWMHSFAQDAARRSPDGSMLHSLVAVAHLEVMTDREGEAATQYISRADVRRDLRTAAEYSIWHPAAQFRPGSAVYLNTFALAFSVSGDLPAAAAVFGQIGGNLTSFPWGYLPGEPAKNFLIGRNSALGHA